MALRSVIRSSRDMVFLLSAFAMVLYVTLAPHRPAGLEGHIASATETIIVGDAVADFGRGAAEKRLASVEPRDALE